MTYEPAHTGVDAAVVFLAGMPTADGLHLLEERRRIVAERHVIVAAELALLTENNPLEHIAGDHLLSLIDAELDWIDRSLAYLRERGWGDTLVEEPANIERRKQSRGRTRIRVKIAHSVLFSKIGVEK